MESTEQNKEKIIEKTYQHKEEVKITFESDNFPKMMQAIKTVIDSLKLKQKDIKKEDYISISYSVETKEVI